jgi:hypothetical protein
MSYSATKESIDSLLDALNICNNSWTCSPTLHKYKLSDGYRRFAEWIVSECNQEMKQKIRSLTKDRNGIAFGEWYAQQLYGTWPHDALRISNGAALRQFQTIFQSAPE